MGSEISVEEDEEYQNGDVKKDDDLRENGADESEIDKENHQPKQDAGVKHQNGNLRSRKTGKTTSKTKAELRRVNLKTKPPSRKEQQKSLAPKWLSAINTLPRSVRRLLILLAVVVLAFGTRLFNVSLPQHIWLVQFHFNGNNFLRLMV